MKSGLIKVRFEVKLFSVTGCQTGPFCPVGTEGADDTFPSDWRPPMAMSGNTAAGRNQLTSRDDRENMPEDAPTKTSVYGASLGTDRSG